MIFKKIKDYNYEVSDCGIVRNIKTGKTLKPRPASNYGHLKVRLYKNGIGENFSVHRLVLRAFVGNCPVGMETCHNDGIASNNKLENLRWDTRLSNNHDMIKHGTQFLSRGVLNGRAKLKEEQIKDIRNKYRHRSKNANACAIAREYGVSPQQVYNIVKNNAWRHI